MSEQLEVVPHRQRKPALWDSATELPRILLEVTSLAYSWPFLAGVFACAAAFVHLVIVRVEVETRLAEMDDLDSELDL